MIGIQNIGYYIPQRKRSNYDFKEKFNIDDEFIENKIGIKYTALKEDGEEASDLCVKAYNNLESEIALNIKDIDCIVVVTQNPDYNLPHTSAIVHGKLNATETCACFDVSLGCSGYVYGLSIIKSFMESNGMKNGLLFTADPYSKNINEDDKNTLLLFGDAASVTLLSEDYRYQINKFDFGTAGKDYESLKCEEKISMNGRAIFNFAAKKVPQSIKNAKKLNETLDDELDCVILHQGSKYIVDTLIKITGIEDNKVPFDAAEYGNTISSSIPIILKKEFSNELNKILISGFGVGLSWASTILKLKND